MSESDGEMWSAPGHRSKCYHSDPFECPTIRQPSRYQRRSEAYIAWHDLERCAHCHDDVKLHGGGWDAERILAEATDGGDD